jgi:hypothetical protein
MIVMIRCEEGIHDGMFALVCETVVGLRRLSEAFIS